MIESGATLSPCGLYRYALWRMWDRSLATVVFCGLNPSTADASKDDATIRRELAFARSWGFGRLVKVNLYAYRSTDPRAMLAADDPRGPDNMPTVLQYARDATLFVACWGNHAREADAFVMRTLLRQLGVSIHVLRLTKRGAPEHPLRLPANLRPVTWPGGKPWPDNQRRNEGNMSKQELDSGDNLIFLFDVSYSMLEADTPTGATRLDYAKEKAIALVNEASKYDPDGVDIGVFGKGARWLEQKATGSNAAALINPLRPSDGQTDTHAALQMAYDLHVAKEHIQTFCFLVTDGEPSNREAVKGTIRGIAASLRDEHEFAIGILPVGDLAKNESLASFLRELDDTLGAKHDIVDVTRLEEAEDLIQIATKALHD